MDITDYFKFFAALIFVLAMMGGLAFALKKLGLAGVGGGLMTGKRRLKTIEMINIDAKNKAAIIECDDKQHLVLLNAGNASIIESNIKPPKVDEKK